MDQRRGYRNRRGRHERQAVSPAGRSCSTALSLVAASLLIAGCATTGGPAESTLGPNAPTPSSVSTLPGSPTSVQPSTTANPNGAAAASWTTYQGGNAHLGDAPGGPPPTPLHMAWSNALDGSAVYGQPLVYNGMVLVATEDDDVFALDASNGKTLWETRLGSPLRNVASQAGCGDVDPLGVTSTPVIDTATGVIYVLAELSNSGRAPIRHQLFGIDTATGTITSNVNADPPLGSPESAVHLLQRAALAFSNGRVYVGYGGQYGDCGFYHGWIVSVPVSGGSNTAFNVTPAGSGGAVWDGGSGPAVGANGDVFVTTGNPNSSKPAPWAESVVKLAPGLGPTPLAHFQDPVATGDLDLSTGGPILLPDGDLFAVGKTDFGYLLRQSDLSRVAPIAGRICGSDPDGGAAWDASTDSIYVPCRSGGIQQVDLASLRTGWRSGSANSTVVLSGGALWSLRYPNGILQELNPANGAVLASIQVGRRVPNFASPTPLNGSVLVPTDSGVTAFSGPAT